MSHVSFACPKCDGCFSKGLDDLPDDTVVDAVCPHCMYEFELKLDETTIHILNLEEARRLR